MESSTDKEWASKYLLDPLNAPEPHEVDGPGTHFVPPPSSTSSTPAPSKAYPSPPTSASPKKTEFHSSNPYAQSSRSHRQQAFEGLNDGPSQRTKPDDPQKPTTRPRRTSSLSQRFPGDNSHRPLETLRKEAKLADRSPHLKKKHIPGADMIDTLDPSTFGGPYHHGGPYDATLISRNLTYKISPVAATRTQNNEAIRATPREHIRDALDKHVPLQGVAVIPPGMRDLSGREMRYNEGADLMREPDAEGGAYKRWPGEKYHPDDLKGKGEPSYSIEKALKEHKNNSHRRVMSDGDSAYEMQTPTTRPRNSRLRSVSGNEADLRKQYNPKDGASTSVNAAVAASSSSSSSSSAAPKGESSVERSNIAGGNVGQGLKKRFGSLSLASKRSDI